MVLPPLSYPDATASGCLGSAFRIHPAKADFECSMILPLSCLIFRHSNSPMSIFCAHFFRFGLYLLAKVQCQSSTGMIYRNFEKSSPIFCKHSNVSSTFLSPDKVLRSLISISFSSNIFWSVYRFIIFNL